MAVCQRCDRHVSDRFARVGGDNDDVVHGCPKCSDRTFTPGRASAGVGDRR